MHVSRNSTDDSKFVTGKVVKIERQTTTQSGGSTTDQPLQSNVASYKIVINVDDTNYTCAFQRVQSADPTWLEGREIQVRVEGKTMYAKRANGDIEHCSIVSKDLVK